MEKQSVLIYGASRVLGLVLALSPASCPLEINLPAMTEREV